MNFFLKIKNASAPQSLGSSAINDKLKTRRVSGIQIGETSETPKLEALPVKMEAVDLSVYYGKFQAIKEISIQIPENKITSLFFFAQVLQPDE